MFVCILIDFYFFPVRSIVKQTPVFHTVLTCLEMSVNCFCQERNDGMYSSGKQATSLRSLIRRSVNQLSSKQSENKQKCLKRYTDFNFH